MTNLTPPPAWHPDPDDPTGLRYWDGNMWTEHRAPSNQTVPEPTEPTEAKRRKWPWVVGAVVAAFAIPAIFGDDKDAERDRRTSEVSEALSANEIDDGTVDSMALEITWNTLPLNEQAVVCAVWNGADPDTSRSDLLDSFFTNVEAGTMSRADVDRFIDAKCGP